ncbi:MAG TPA: glycosyltransferase family protein [Caulobacteraceae bacterium]|jgi:spore coat polysaccharide biosynthesis protein SpsF
MILAVLQARMSSTRLPGKVLRDLVGAPMLARQVERLRRAERIDRLVIATSDQPEDEPVARLGADLGLGVHRGSLDDVLSRFIGALDAFGPAEHVVRLTGDCPLADPELIDRLIALHVEQGTDYAHNTGDHRTFAHGLDAEVMRADALRTAHAEADESYEREHVTPFIYRRPDRFRLIVLKNGAEEGEARWTVDTPEDFAFVEAVYEGLYPANPAFGSADVRRLVASRPDLAALGGFPRL